MKTHVQGARIAATIAWGSLTALNHRPLLRLAESRSDQEHLAPLAVSSGKPNPEVRKKPDAQIRIPQTRFFLLGRLLNANNRALRGYCVRWGLAGSLAVNCCIHMLPGSCHPSCRNAMAPHRRGIVFVALAMMSYAGAVAFGQAPELILHPAASQIPDRVVMSIRPHSTNWVLLEASSDLKDWQPVVNFMTTLTSGPFIDVPPSPSPVRFYRARAPGVSAATALSAWQAVRPAHYQYRFHFVKGQTSINVWEGTVTISNGVKTVSNVIVNENPTTTFNPADFLTPEEVFGFIATVEAQGARLAHVAYDPQWHFPSSVLTLLDQAPSFADYRMAGFVELSGAAVSTNGEPGAPANGSLPGGPRAFRSQWSRTIAALNTGARGK